MPARFGLLWTWRSPGRQVVLSLPTLDDAPGSWDFQSELELVNTCAGQLPTEPALLVVTERAAPKVPAPLRRVFTAHDDPDDMGRDLDGYFQKEEDQLRGPDPGPGTDARATPIFAEKVCGGSFEPGAAG